MNNKAIVGRDPGLCDIVVDQEYGRVSRSHATLEIQDGQLIFKDHSTNGSMVNGRKIQNSSIAIRRGDKILLANTYELTWPIIIGMFPSLQPHTPSFDGSRDDTYGRSTEMLNPSVGENSHRDTEHMSRPLDPGEATAGQPNDFAQVEVDDYLDKFNPGAFLSSWVWALCNRIYWPLFIIPISLIPYIGQISSLFLCSYLGIDGSRMAWHKTNEPFDKFVSTQKKWVGVGIILFLIFTAVQLLSLYYILSLI